jgi:hypothetical protein
MKMLFTKNVETLIEATLASSYVEDEQETVPVNLMLSTLSGGGKSSLLLKRYGNVPRVVVHGDITYMKLADTYLDRAHDGKDMTWIFPEFNKILGRKHSVASNTVGLIDEACEEGVPSISLPYFERRWNPPARVSVIIGLTPSFLKAHAVNWWGFGFLQRFLVFTWRYTDRQIRTILFYIKHQHHLKEGVWSQNFDIRQVILAEKYSDYIESELTHEFCKNMSDYIRRLDPHFEEETESELPFRTQMRLQKLLKGLARRNNHAEVTNDDWVQFRRLFENMNCNYLEL